MISVAFGGYGRKTFDEVGWRFFADAQNDKRSAWNGKRGAQDDKRGAPNGTKAFRMARGRICYSRALNCVDSRSCE